MAFTSKDVARVAGVSQSTVSYVMTGKRPISQATRDKVLAAMEELTYHPHAGARALAGRRTNVIGLVLPVRKGSDVAGQLPFIHAIAELARVHDYDVLLVAADEGPAGLKRVAGRAICDALVMMEVKSDDERVPVAASLGIPVVLIGIPNDPQGLYCVDVDFAEAARLAVEDLSNSGHRRLTVVGYPAAMVHEQVNFVHRFMDAVEENARRCGLKLNVIIPKEPGRVAADDVVRRLLSGRRETRHGVIVTHAGVLRPLLTALARRGVVPGEDLTLIGHLTDQAAQECDPPVTNVSLEPRSVCERAVETLFWLLDPVPGIPPAQTSLVAPRLTHRATTLPPLVPSPRS